MVLVFVYCSSREIGHTEFFLTRALQGKLQGFMEQLKIPVIPCTFLIAFKPWTDSCLNWGKFQIALSEYALLSSHLINSVFGTLWLPMQHKATSLWRRGELTPWLILSIILSHHSCRVWIWTRKCRSQETSHKYFQQNQWLQITCLPLMGLCNRFVTSNTK